jgi:nucleotide-binding universal stress UspA family protein
MGRGRSERRLGSTLDKELEMTTETPRRVVVGYDGSPASRAALAYAAQRAGEDGQLYIVHAFALPGDWLGMPNYQEMLDHALDRARERVQEIEHHSGADLEGVAWDTEVIGDAPAEAIARVATAREADEIVIGTRGFGRARALLGSVAHELIHLADRPITVIPERAVARAEQREKAVAT